MRNGKLIMAIGLIGLIFFGLMVFYVRATTEWVQQYPLGYDAHTRSAARTDDGGYILAGHNRLNSATSSKALLAKIDSSGRIQWYKSYGVGGRFTDEAHSVAQASDGGYAVAGVTWVSNTTGHFWVFKVDASGNMQWNKTYGGIHNDNAWSIVKTGDGGYAVAGFSNNFGPGDSDFWLVKIDSSGAVQWNKVYGTAGNDIAYSVIQASDGGYAITGRQNGHQLWLVKTDSSGNTLWNKTYGDPKLGSVGYSLVQTSDGGYAMGGSTNTPSDFFIVKTDSNGVMQWSKTYGGESEEIARSLVQAADGGYLLAGYTESYGAGTQDVWLVKTDSSGNAQWDQTYGGANTDVANYILKTGDGGYLLEGNTESFGFASAALLLIKTDSAGLSKSAPNPETSAWEPPPENAVASTVAAAVVTSGVSIVVAAALIPPGLPTDTVTQRIRDFLPSSLKSWLEALMSSKMKLAIDEKPGSPFLPTKSEVMVYAVSVVVMGFSFSYAKVDALSQIMLVLPVIIGTSIVVGFVKTVILVGYARVRGVWTENKLWYFGLATFLVTTFLFRVPFSSPSRIVHHEAGFTKRLGAILSLAKIGISLAFAGGFYLLMMGGYPAIGSVGLAMCIIGAFFDSLPIPPLNGRTIFSYSKFLWGAIFAATLALYCFWLFLL